jgi:glyceraldehyde 3-phosphate dehydrogenase
MTDPKMDEYLRRWKQREQAAEAMVPIIGRLYRERGVIVKVFGDSLVNKDRIEIIQAIRFARQILESEISVLQCLPMLEAIAKLDLGPVRIDLGTLVTNFYQRSDQVDMDEYVAEVLAPVATGCKPLRARPQDIVLYGFGRVGRLVARIMIGKAGGGDNFRLRAIVVRPGGEDDLEKRASLLRHDSVHGDFHGSIVLDEKECAMVANGNMIRVIYANSPDEIDYTKYGIEDAILVDNTGKWREEEGLRQHLKSPGISHVVLTAPGKGSLPNIVYGVNHDEIHTSGPILTAASCTTNAIVPVLKVVNDRFGIVHGHVESVHSFTNDQNLIDNYHAKKRRGRSAALNMVVTSTGAASAVAKVLPELKGKITGNAIRVPTPDVSLAILQLELSEETTVDELNHYLRDNSIGGKLQNQIDYTNSDEVVSCDFVGNRHACIVDSKATIVDGRHCVLYVWYDNEFGYARQVVRIVDDLAGLGTQTFPL